MAHKVVPLLALIALGLLLSDVSATGSSFDEDFDPRNDFSPEETEFDEEVPSKDEDAAPVQHHAKASSRHRSPTAPQKPVTKVAAAHPESSRKAAKPSKDSLVEEPVDAEEEEEPVEQFEDEGDDDADQQEAEAAFDEMDAEEQPQGNIALGHPDAVAQEQMAQQQKAKEESKHVKSTLARIRKLGVHFGGAARPRAAPVVQQSQILSAAPPKAVEKESSSGLVHVETSGLGASAKPSGKTSKFLKDRVWMLGASESMGTLGKAKVPKTAPAPRAEIIQEANTEEGKDAPHPNSIVNPEFHSFAGKYRRDWSVYSKRDPKKLSKATLELDEISGIDPKTGKSEFQTKD